MQFINSKITVEGLLPTYLLGQVQPSYYRCMREAALSLELQLLIESWAVCYVATFQQGSLEGFPFPLGEWRACASGLEELVI